MVLPSVSSLFYIHVVELLFGFCASTYPPFLVPCQLLNRLQLPGHWGAEGLRGGWSPRGAVAAGRGRSWVMVGARALPLPYKGATLCYSNRLCPLGSSPSFLFFLPILVGLPTLNMKLE